jgi:hypothetical protein
LLRRIEARAALKPVCYPRPGSIQDPLLAIFVLHVRPDHAFDNPHLGAAPAVFSIGANRIACVSRALSSIVSSFLLQLAALLTSLAPFAPAFQRLQIAFGRLISADLQSHLPAREPSLTPEFRRAAGHDDEPATMAGDLRHVADRIWIRAVARQLVAAVAERWPDH